MAANSASDKALYIAAGKGDTMGLITAKNQGANINSKTPIMIAAKCGKKPEVEQLLHWGANVEMKVQSGFDMGKTAAGFAKDNGHAEIAKIITDWQQKQEEEKKKKQGAARAQAPGPPPAALLGGLPPSLVPSPSIPPPLTASSLPPPIAK